MLRVSQAFLLPRRYVPTSSDRSSRRSPRSLCWKLVAAHAHDLVTALLAAQGGMDQAMLEELRHSPPQACMGLPPLLSAHVALGYWTEICIPARPVAWVRSQIQPGVLGEIWTYFPERPAGFSLPPEPVMETSALSASLCQRAADAMRILAQAARHCQGQAAPHPDHWQEATTMVALLQRAADAQKPPDLLLAASSHPKGGLNGYSIKHLLQAMLMTSRLRSSAYLQEVIQRAVDMVCTAEVAADIKRELTSGTLAVPSAATLSRHQQTLLAGFLLHQRRSGVPVADPESIRYLLVDASPQGGREWLLVAVSSIPHAELQKALQAVEVLHGSQRQHDEAEIAQCQTYLKRMLRFRPLLPAGLGSGRASCTHKLHAMVWTIFLACGANWYDAAEALSNAAGFTTDHGTERLLSIFPRCPLATLFSWADIDLEHLVNGNVAGQVLVSVSCGGGVYRDSGVVHEGFVSL